MTDPTTDAHGWPYDHPHRWRAYLTDAEERALDAGEIPMREKRRISREIAFQMHQDADPMPLQADSIFRDMPAADDLDGVHELLQAVNARCDAVPDRAPAMAGDTPQRQTETIAPPCAKAMEMIEHCLPHVHGNSSIPWGPTVWHLSQVVGRTYTAADRRGGKRKWAGVGETSEIIKKRWERACDLQYFEAILATLPGMPLTGEQRQMIEALCVAGIALGNDRARRGRGTRKPPGHVPGKPGRPRKVATAP